MGIDRKELTLRGQPGQSLEETLVVRSEEKRAVYAHGTSNQPWLEVGRARLNGRHAAITLAIPAVPNRPGEVLKARLTVQANGNQRFVVPVTLEVEGKPFDFRRRPRTSPKSARSTRCSRWTRWRPLTNRRPCHPRARQRPWRLPLLRGPPPAARAVPGAAPRGSLPGATPCLRSLVLLLGGVLALDVVKPVHPGEGNDGPDLGQSSEISWKYNIVDHEPLLGYVTNDHDFHGRFGLLLLKEADPLEPEKRKRLTFYEDGTGNNVCLRIDGQEPLFGYRPGEFGATRRRSCCRARGSASGRPGPSRKSR